MPLTLLNTGDTFRGRLGTFRVSEPILRSDPERLAPVFRDIIIVQATHDFAREEIVYVGMSPCFAPVEPLTSPPSYDAIMVEQESGTTVHWKRAA